MDAEEVLARPEHLSDRSRLEGMARYGIRVDRALGVSMPEMRGLARTLGTDHGLAMDLWQKGVHEARTMTSLVADPLLLTEEQAEGMVGDLCSWDVCDHCRSNLFRRSTMAYRKSLEWSGRSPQFEKRAGFVTMAALAAHDKELRDHDLLPFLEAAIRESNDGRTYVRKAVNWTVRRIGKRDLALNAFAIDAAKRIGAKGDRGSEWVASSGLRELESAAVRERLKNRHAK